MCNLFFLSMAIFYMLWPMLGVGPMLSPEAKHLPQTWLSYGLNSNNNNPSRLFRMFRTLLESLKPKTNLNIVIIFLLNFCCRMIFWTMFGPSKSEEICCYLITTTNKPWIMISFKKTHSSEKEEEQGSGIQGCRPWRCAHFGSFLPLFSEFWI